MKQVQPARRPPQSPASPESGKSGPASPASPESGESGPGARAAWALGIAGLIPFFLAGAALWAGPERFGWAVFIAPVALLGYGATIVSFLGGVRWGAEMGRAGGPRPVVMALSTAPQVLAWLCIVAPIPTVGRWGGLILLLAITGSVDAASPDLPAWYRRLRIPLSVGAVTALASGLAWTIALAHSLAPQGGG